MLTIGSRTAALAAALIALAGPIAVHSGPASASPPTETPTQISTRTQSVGRDIRVEVLKRAIVSIARGAQGACDQDDNDPVVSKGLRRLTSKLVRISPPRTETDKLAQVAGGWKQEWADLRIGSPNCTDADSIYQVVSPDGYYWNISTTRPAAGPPSLGLLRGKFAVTPDFLEIEFTNLAVSPVVPPLGTDLVDLATRAERGEFVALPPFFPVGVKGELKNVYVDDDLRIVTGDDDSPGSVDSIFVLTRADVTR